MDQFVRPGEGKHAGKLMSQTEIQKSSCNEGCGCLKASHAR